jgi:hypothetical protein
LTVALNLSDIVNVAVYVSPVYPARSTFNHGLIIGTSSVIPVATRLREYSTTAAMLTDGFSIANSEYLAAQLYFSQSPAPLQLWVGVQSTTAGAMQTVTIGNAGTGYIVGDILTVNQSENMPGTVKVATIGASGTVIGITVTNGGDGYIDATALTTSGGTGTGCTVNITATTPETALQAVQACRLANNDWYTCMVCGAADADHLAIASYIETATPTSTYMYTTTDSAVLNNTAGNIMATLMGYSYKRNLGLYSTQTANAVAALMGVAMGLNTGLANSAYTLKFKTLVGVLADPLTQTQVTNIESNNGNVYVNYTGGFVIAEQGTMANGQFFDEVINLDMLSNNIQLNVMDLLISNPKIPLTDAGVTQIMRAVNSACDQAVTIGFLAPGIWNGVQILSLNTGDPITKGYITQAPSVNTLTTQQRTSRQSPPIYVSITEAGAVHSVTIGVYVQR